MASSRELWNIDNYEKKNNEIINVENSWFSRYQDVIIRTLVLSYISRKLSAKPFYKRTGYPNIFEHTQNTHIYDMIF